MIPLRLQISGFLSYRDPVTLDFSGFNLACISGSNGAGKSSILDAITWALFGQARKRDESLINSHPQVKAAQVTLDFAYEGNVYRVLRSLPRGKITSLEYFIFQDEGEKNTPERIRAYASFAENGRPWKPLTERTLRDTQRRIEETLCLDYETFVNASFFLQGKADLFTQQKPGDRKRILSSILGLEIWESYRQLAAEARKGYEAEITGILGRMGEIDSELREEMTRRERLHEIEERLKSLVKLRSQQEAVLANVRKIVATLNQQRELVQTLARQLDMTQRNVENLGQRKEVLLKEQKAQQSLIARKDEITSAYQQWKSLRLKLEEWENTALRFREQEKHRQVPLDEINHERARLMQEQEGLDKSWGEVLVKVEQIPPLEKQVEHLRIELSRIAEKLEQRTAIEAQLEQVRQKIAEASAENLRLKQEMDMIKERIEKLEMTESPQCPVCGKELNAEDRQSLISELGMQGTSLGDRYRANREMQANADQEAKDLRTQMASLEHIENERLSVTEALTRLTTQIEQIQEGEQTWLDQIEPRRIEIKTLIEQEQFCQDARQRLSEIDRELIAIGYDAVAHDDLRRQEIMARQVEQEYLALERAKVALTALEGELSNLLPQIAKHEEDLTLQTNAHDQAVAHLAAAEAEAPDFEAAEREVISSQEQENRLRLELGAAQQKVDVLDDLKARRKQLLEQQEEKATLVSQHKQLERAFSKDGVPALLIEQALPQIEARANETLDLLTGSEMTIKFVTQAEFKDKKREDLKETLDIRISDSSGVRDYEMYSGGEAFRVNFAIRLALSEVLAHRAGASLQTLVIDEGFGSQDTQGRQKLIEAINLVQPNFAKILVITHIEELKDAFPTRIEVEKTERGSVLQVI